jgi:hypothetical protein
MERPISHSFPQPSPMFVACALILCGGLIVWKVARLLMLAQLLSYSKNISATTLLPITDQKMKTTSLPVDFTPSSLGGFEPPKNDELNLQMQILGIRVSRLEQMLCDGTTISNEGKNDDGK